MEEDDTEGRNSAAAEDERKGELAHSSRVSRAQERPLIDGTGQRRGECKEVRDKMDGAPVPHTSAQGYERRERKAESNKGHCEFGGERPGGLGRNGKNARNQSNECKIGPAG